MVFVGVGELMDYWRIGGIGGFDGIGDGIDDGVDGIGKEREMGKGRTGMRGGDGGRERSGERRIDRITRERKMKKREDVV